MNDNNALSEILLKWVNNASTLYFVYDTDQHSFVYLNAAFEISWQLTKEKVYANAAILWDTIHAEDKNYMVKAFKLLLLQGNIRNIEFRRQLQETIQFLKVDAQVINHQGDTYIAGVAEDITPAREYLDKVNKFTEKKNSI